MRCKKIKAPINQTRNKLENVIKSSGCGWLFVIFGRLELKEWQSPSVGLLIFILVVKAYKLFQGISVIFSLSSDLFYRKATIKVNMNVPR